MATLVKRCDCPSKNTCPHKWSSILRIGGKRVQLALAIRKAEAQIMLAELVKKQQRGGEVSTLSPGAMPIEEFKSAYLAHCLANKKTPSYQAEARALRALVGCKREDGKPLVTRLGDVTPDALEILKASWIKSGRVVLDPATRIAKKLGTACNRELMAIKTIMRWAEDQHKLPAQNWRRPKAFKIPNKGRRTKWFDAPERAKLEAGLEDYLLTVYMLGYFAGLRPGEMTHLWWEDVDFDHDLLHVKSKEWLEDGKQRYWTPKAEDSKTAGASRSIALHPDLKAYLLSIKDRAHGRWVVEYAGRHIGINSTARAWKNRLKLLGVAGCPYTLRHTFAVEYMRAGGNIYDLQHLMGHASVTTTEIYAKFAPKRNMGVANLPGRAQIGAQAVLTN